jgi:uncharacterized protein (TIGR03435 family)
LLRSVQFVLLAVLPMVGQPPPAFDVASVKPSQPRRNAEGGSYSSVDVVSPGRLVAENSSLDELIRSAYDLKDYQVFGPAWLNDQSESFDIVAKASPDTPEKQMWTMLQTLLAERFKLVAHREKRMLPAYDLVVSKKGFQLKPATSGGRRSTASQGGNLIATHLTMADFAYQLSRELKRPVFDKTGMAGAFDFTLHYSPGQDASGGPSLFTAIQETIGVRLESVREPVEVLVVDHIEKRPTEN